MYLKKYIPKFLQNAYVVIVTRGWAGLQISSYVKGKRHTLYLSEQNQKHGILKLFGYIGSLLILIWLPWQAFAVKPIRLVLDWYPNPDHAALLYANAAGYFKQAGLNVQLIPPADSTIGIKMVATGKADIAVSYEPSLVLAQQQGLDITWLATLVAQPLDSLVVLDNGSIQTLSDLKGKTIGYSTPGIDPLMVRIMLQYVHVKLSDVTLINMPDNLMQGLMHKQISALQGAMRNVEPFTFASQGIKIKQFFPENYGFPMYDELILVCSSKNISDARYQSLVLALTKASIALKADPISAWKIVIKKYPSLNTQVNYQSWLATIPLLSSNPDYYNAKRYQQFATFMRKQQATAFIY